MATHVQVLQLLKAPEAAKGHALIGNEDKALAAVRSVDHIAGLKINSAADRAGASFFGVSVEKFSVMRPYEKALAFQRSKVYRVEMPAYTREPPYGISMADTVLAVDRLKKKEDSVYTRIEKKIKKMKTPTSKCRWHAESLALVAERSNAKMHKHPAPSPGQGA